MAGSHSERADELAAQANKALQEALKRAESAARSPLADHHETMELVWQRVRAIQAQAQIHATLALSDNVYRSGGL
ncbi:hypothetical protein [Nocardia wallacei]|uniref:hypothetical protein n=1 Tax=Nocardia wallacei TaxID=480035 RepID=UPI0024572E74|nr:hypothetical protein [Nocardia wallacei]